LFWKKGSGGNHYYVERKLQIRGTHMNGIQILNKMKIMS
jgi:hypothetical protein